MNYEIKRIIKLFFPGIVKKISDDFHYNSFKGKFRTFDEATRLTKATTLKKLGIKLNKFIKKVDIALMNLIEMAK